MTVPNTLTATRTAHTRATHSSSTDPSTSRSLGFLTKRYPYLAPACRKDNTAYRTERRQLIQQWEAAQQQTFDRQLVRYTLYRLRSTATPFAPNHVCSAICDDIVNPTLLDDSELFRGLRCFAGKKDNLGTIRDRARKFLIYTKQGISYAEFQKALYCYLVDVSQDCRVNCGVRALWKLQAEPSLKARQTPLTPELLTRAVQQILDLLTTERGCKGHGLSFLDLLNGGDLVSIASLFLKLVLITDPNEAPVQRQLMKLVKRYERYSQTEVYDIVKLLEHFNLALSVNVGNSDVSYLFTDL